MNTMRFFILGLLAANLGSCTSYVANQVLGDKAIPVDVGANRRLTAPAVYMVQKDGSYSNPYCVKDFELQNALKPIKVTKDATVNDTINDQLATDNITFGFPGIPTVQIPYRKTRVVGYTVTRAEAPDSTSFYDFVRDGVGANCRKLLDSGKFIVVEQEARAVKSYRVTKGPIDSIQLGALKIGGLGQEVVTPAPSNVTFGIVGSTGAATK